MTQIDPRPVLITGGTGMQGRPTVEAAVRRGITVRALVRDPQSEVARAFSEQGVQVVAGSFEDEASLDRAMAGVRSVFSLQLAIPEVANAQQQALLGAAGRAGVEQFVQSTVSSTGLHESFPGWSEGRWSTWYWEDKAQQEAAPRAAGFRFLTMIRPAMLMDNFLADRARFMHPELAEGGTILTAARGDTPIAYVSSETVGAAGAAALAEPERFNGLALELADELLSLDTAAAVLTEVTGKPVVVDSRTYADLVAAGKHEGLVRSQEWLNEVGYAARPDMLADYGLTPLPFRTWAERHLNEFEIGRRPA